MNNVIKQMNKLTQINEQIKLITESLITNIRNTHKYKQQQGNWTHCHPPSKKLKRNTQVFKNN